MPEDAEREWFFYEGLKQMSKLKGNQEIDQMKHEVFVDYADAKEEMKAEKSIVPSHLPPEITHGLHHAKQIDKAIGIVADS